MDISEIRKQIPVCQRMTYVNTGQSGPSPINVITAIKDRLNYEMTEGPTSPEVFSSGLEIQIKAKYAVASLINASPDEVCVTRNTTEGLNIIINGLAWEPGDEIITCDLEHSSVLVPSRYQQRRHGAVVNVLSVAPDENWGSILQKIDEAISEHTKLVFLSHVEYSSGLRMPVKEIRRLLKGRGIYLLLDGAQSAGQIALDMKELDCDFYSIPGHKWLLGSEGVGALYIRSDLIAQIEATFVAGRAVVHNEDPHSYEANETTMDKFLLTSTNIALQAGLVEAIDFVKSVGLNRIEARNVELAGLLKQSLAGATGVIVLSPQNQDNSSGIVTVAIDGLEPDDAVSRLWGEHRIVCRHVGYPRGIRFSLHFFNTEEEVHKVAEAVRGLASVPD